MACSEDKGEAASSLQALPTQLLSKFQFSAVYLAVLTAGSPLSLSFSGPLAARAAPGEGAPSPPIYLLYRIFRI
jgi:hypothetical protein